MFQTFYFERFLSETNFLVVFPSKFCNNPQLGKLARKKHCVLS